MQQNQILRTTRKDNTLGITGVSLCYTYSRNKSRTKLYYYQADIYEDGKRKKKQFFIKKYGNNQALQMAIKTRRDYEQQKLIS